MMKYCMFIVIIVICIIIASCAAPTENTQPDSSSTPVNDASDSQPAETANNIPTKEAALAYTDPKIDLVIMLDSPGWAYTKERYPGEVFFYPKDKNTQAGEGFAITSQVRNDKTDIDAMWKIVKNSLEKSIKGLTIKQEADVNAEACIMKRYHYTGIMEKDKEIIGDYFFWTTEKRLYICSFTSSKEDYEKNLSTVMNALKTFKIAGNK